MPDSKRHFLKQSEEYSSTGKKSLPQGLSTPALSLIKTSLLSYSPKGKQNEGSYARSSQYEVSAVCIEYFPTAIYINQCQNAGSHMKPEDLPRA